MEKTESTQSFHCCSEAEEALHRYVDSELPSEEQPALFAHLSSCARCRVLMESVLQFRRMSRQEKIAVPPAADEAFLKRLASHKANRPSTERRTRRTRFRRVAVATAAVAFLVGMLFPLQAGEESVSASAADEREQVAPPMPEPTQAALYVFYPGLTVEAKREEEPDSPEAL